MIPPGNGLHVQLAVVNVGVYATFQWNEENV